MFRRCWLSNAIDAFVVAVVLLVLLFVLLWQVMLLLFMLVLFPAAAVSDCIAAVAAVGVSSPFLLNLLLVLFTSAHEQIANFFDLQLR